MKKRTRPVDGVTRRYEWALYPTLAQEETLRRHAVMCGQLWNALLEMCETRYRRGCQGAHVFHCAACAAASEGAGKVVLCGNHDMPSEFDMGGWISQLRAECPEWRDLSTWVPRRVATSLGAAFAAFFRRLKNGEAAGYPHYKTTHRNLAVPHRCVSGCSFAPYDPDMHGTVNGHARKSGPRNWIVTIKGIVGPVWAMGKPAASVAEWTDVDIRHRDGRWTASAAMAVAPRRIAGSRPMQVRFDLLDGLALVDNVPETPQELIDAQAICEAADARKRACDLAYPRGKRLTEAEREAMRQQRDAIAADLARAARKRRNALHVWTARLVARASSIIVVAPKIKAMTSTGRGTRAAPGAAVGDVARINRAVLSLAPSLAIQMLKYKAAESGIECRIIEDETPKIAISGALKGAAREVRRLSRRAVRELANA